MNTYYFPINSLSLAHYFGSACIKAAKYFTNKPQDIQDKYNAFLLLTNKLGTTETDCCLELVLTEDETKDLIDVKNGWFLFDAKPLPITRIKKIYFSDKEQSKNTITNITMSTAFVPENLVEIRTFEDNKTEDIQVPVECQEVDQTDKIIQYDRFLGALALMRLAHEPYMNYSQNYIATLSFFNQTIDNQVKTNEKLLFNNAFQGIFNRKGFEKVLPYLELSIDEESLNRIAKEENQEIKKDKITRIIDFESINDKSWTYIIAYLNAYGVGEESRKMRIDGLIHSNFTSLREGKNEGVALCYGYNRGYSVFAKSYGDVAYKYKLESQLDYYTIESVYQYVFNGIFSTDFPYLDSWCPKLNPKQPKKKTDYVVLDEVIVGKKKAKLFSQEWWNGLFPNFEKTFASLAKPIFDSLKSFIENEVYSDIKDDLEEQYEQKLEEQRQIETQLRDELNTANETIKLLKTKEQHNQYYQQENVQTLVVAEPEAKYDEKSSSLEKAVLNYQDYTLKDLKGRMTTKATNDTKLKDLLLNQPSDLFTNS